MEARSAVVCMFLENPVHTDGRVIKLIRKISQKHQLHLFYHSSHTNDSSLFNEKVHLHRVPVPSGWKAKLLRHSYFYRLHDSLLQEALHCGLKFDYCWCNDLTTLYAGICLKKKQGLKLIYDSHEIYLETLNQFFPAQSNGLKKWIFDFLLSFMRSKGEDAEREFLHSVDEFVTVNQSLSDFFHEKYKYPRPIHLIMNCPPLWIPQQSDGTDFRKKYKWGKDDFIYLFQGSLNQGRGLELLMRLIPSLPTDLKFVFLGRGPLYQVMESWIQKQKLEQRVKIGQVSSAEILSCCAAADAGINLLEPINKSKEFTSATKLFEYIQVGIPSVCSNVIENRRIFEKYPIGRLIENRESDLREALIALAADPPQKYQEALNRAAAEYCWENQSGVIDKLIP